MDIDYIAYFASSVDMATLELSVHHRGGYQLHHLKTIAFNLGIECKWYSVTKTMLVDLIRRWYWCNYSAIREWNDFKPC